LDDVRSVARSFPGNDDLNKKENTMKKLKKTRRFTLERETIRTVGADRLTHIAGGSACDTGSYPTGGATKDTKTDAI
jgi:hypothetical protein